MDEPEHLRSKCHGGGRRVNATMAGRGRIGPGAMGFSNRTPAPAGPHPQAEFLRGKALWVNHEDGYQIVIKAYADNPEA